MVQSSGHLATERPLFAMREKIIKILNYRLESIPIVKIIIIYEILFWLYNFLFQPFVITGSFYGMSVSGIWYERMFTFALGVPVVFVLLILIWYKIPRK